MKPWPDLIVFTMAGHSGMGRFASEMARAAGQGWDGSVRLIAPPMEHEPGLSDRTILKGPLTQASRPRRVWRQMAMHLDAMVAVWRHTRKGHVFLMIDMYQMLPFSLLPYFAARTRGAYCILNMHDFYPHAFRFPKRLRAIERAFYRLSYRRFDLIAAMRPQQIRRLTQEAGVGMSRIVVIEHGAFPIVAIAPEQGDPVRVLILGSLRQNKNVFETIKAVAMLRAKGLDIRLRIAGAPRRAEPQYWARCKEALNDLLTPDLLAAEVHDRYIEDSELPTMLSGVDALVCPYENFDSQSGVSIMAVSSGIPLVATEGAKVANCDPFVTVAEPVTPETIAEALSRLFQAPRAERFAQAAAMQARFDERSLWAEAVASIAVAAGTLSAQDVPTKGDLPC